MRRVRTLLSELSIATVFSLAVAGLVFPASLFGQPRVVGLEGLVADGHVQIEILELDERGFPAVVTAESDGRKLRFELGEGTFSWVDVDDPAVQGTDELPNLDEISSWDVKLEPDGAFRAAIPLEHFQPSEQVLPDLAPLSKLGDLQLEQRKVETFGAFSPTAKSFELSTILPGGELIDMTVSLEALPPDALLGGGVPVGELTKAFPIFVAISIILAILGLIVISCVGIIAACGFVCAYTCPAGVDDWSARCGLAGGCNCICSGPPPAPETPCGGGSGLVSQDDQLKVAGSGVLELPAEAFTLTRYEESDRVHHGRPVSFLMGEWALLSYTVGGSDRAIEVLRSSSPEFAESRRPGLAAALSSPAKSLSPGRHTVLLVARPDHDANSREIPLPRVQLTKRGSLAPVVGEGRVLVRADFSEDRELQGFEVLHETVGGLSAKVEAGLRQAIGLEYATEKSHRVVVFALLEVAAGEVALADSITYLPKCCCGGEFCF